jgi:hypothetical protein
VTEQGVVGTTEQGVVGTGCEVGVGVRVDGKVDDDSLMLMG